MAQQKVRFQDDLWYIRRVIGLVADAVKIQPDSEFFAEHLFAEIRFAQESVRRLKEILESSPRLMDRGEYFVLLSRSARALSDALSDLAAGDGDLSRAFSDKREEITATSKELRAMTNEIRDLASSALNEGAQEGDIVSGDELSELLRGEAT
jgi:methyl-accepting chemotaxis protein